MGRLPSGYKELEYIQSDGEQYIDTGRKPISTTVLTMDVETLGGAASTSKYFFYSGVTVLSGTRYTITRYSCEWTTAGILVAGCYVTVTSSSLPAAYKKTLSSDASARRMTITMDIKNKKAYIDGAGSTNLDSNTTTSAPAIKLLGTASSTSIFAKLYSCTIKDANGTMEFIPCTNPSGEVGLYDLVTAAFYGNAGTGVFIAGPVIGDEGVSKIRIGDKVANKMYVGNREIKRAYIGENLIFERGGGVILSSNSNNTHLQDYATCNNPSDAFFHNARNGVPAPC